MITFLVALVVATIVIYTVVVKLKVGGTDALRENKERRVPEAAAKTTR